MGQILERDHHFDNIKALLILLVVIGHVISNFGAGAACDILYKIIFSFHMPAFIYVSGYFAKHDPKRVLAKLFPLYVIFQLGWQFIPFIFNSISAGELVPLNMQLFKPNWTLWYLAVLMGYQLLLSIFDTKNKKHQIAYLALACALGIAIGFNAYTDNFLAISRIFTFLPFFLLGYYDKETKIFLTYGKKKHPVLSKAITGCIAVILIVLMAMTHERFVGRIFFGTESYDGTFTWYIRLLTWLVAFLWIWILLVWVPEKQIPLVGKIGEHTLAIYLLHTIAIKILVNTPLRDIIYGNMAAILIVSVILTIVLSWKGFEKIIRKIAIPYK